jgi:hypothetical protein
MSTAARRSAAVIAVAAVASLAIWAVARLAGVDLTVQMGESTSTVGPADVLIASVAAGLAAWTVHAAMARNPRTARWWPFVAAPPSPSPCSVPATWPTASPPSP